ncbi:hypothetical protein B0H13DRAFT_2303770 [Mycena leptocephala]|nr:hypothetical protein B0H13DRAFT_2303770 [Mycena leptocephala]
MSHSSPRRFPFGSPLFCLALIQLCHLIACVKLPYVHGLAMRRTHTFTNTLRLDLLQSLRSVMPIKQAKLINVVEVSSGSTSLCVLFISSYAIIF